MDTFTIADLRKEEVVKQFNTLSTMYIPPRDLTPAHHIMTQRLGLSSLSDNRSAPPAYGRYELERVASIDTHTTPEGYRILQASSAARKLLADLALNPKLREEYGVNPQTVVEARDGLTEREKAALSTGQEGPVYAVMKPSLSDIKSGREADIAGVIKAFTLLVLDVVVVFHECSLLVETSDLQQ